MESENNNSMTIEYIIENYSRMVASICRKMIQNKETAEDAVQEVWLEVNKGLKTCILQIQRCFPSLYEIRPYLL